MPNLEQALSSSSTAGILGAGVAPGQKPGRLEIVLAKLEDLDLRLVTQLNAVHGVLDILAPMLMNVPVPQEASTVAPSDPSSVGDGVLNKIEAQVINLQNDLERFSVLISRLDEI